jgi:hypothetical protein
VERECADCRSGREEEASPSPPAGPISPLRRLLDEQWASANFDGPGCPFCDAMFTCNCWAERAELMRAAERQEARCTCDEDGECENCDARERSRCDYCGAYADEPCRPGCGDHHSEDEHDDYSEPGEPRCLRCGCETGGDEGWGPNLCGRRCALAHMNGDPYSDAE